MPPRRLKDQVRGAAGDGAEARLRLLCEAAEVLLSAAEPEAMLRRLFERIAPRFGLDAYFNFVVNESGDALRMASCHGIPDEEVRRIGRLEFGQAVCGTVALRRQPITATFIQDSDEPMVRLVKGYGIRAYACNPLMAGETLLGTLSFATRTKDTFAEEELEFFRTVSRYVAAAYERLALVRRLQDADRRKDDFLAVLGHELRNPLGTIRTGLEVLRLSRDDVAAADEMMAAMERQVGQMARLIDDLADASRIRRGTLELRLARIDLGEVLRDAVEGARPLCAEAGHELTLSLPESPLGVEGDAARLAQVFGNLLTNACKYTPNGGRIVVAADRREGAAVVAVRDTGVGIPKESLGAVFGMFARAGQGPERNRAGLGLGLHVVRRLVEMHGGDVEARSEGEGKGSEFVVRLPLAEGAGAAS